jgi:hypothetical protein
MSVSTNNREEQNEIRKRSEDVFSSEKRKDIWAILLAILIFILSYIAPNAIHHFFKKTLFLF